MMQDQKMDEFLDVLSSSAPVPGGGGASAYAGAIGTALGAMVANLTIGKKKYADVQEEIKRLEADSQILMKELSLFMDKDAEAFEPLSNAYGLPRQTQEQKKEREEIMEKALVTASETPLALMEKTLEAMKLLDRLSVIGSNLAISDVGVGIQMMRSALLGASLNVFINTKMMKNRVVADEMNQKAEAMIAEGTIQADRIFAVVMDKIHG